MALRGFFTPDAAETPEIDFGGLAGEDLRAAAAAFWLKAWGAAMSTLATICWVLTKDEMQGRPAGQMFHRLEREQTDQTNAVRP